MRIVFVGCVEFSHTTLRWLLEHGPQYGFEVAGVITMEASSFNADFYDLTPLCALHDVPMQTTTNINSSEVHQWVASLASDVMFVFGWSSLIKEELLGLPRLGCVGYHPAALPMNRGRHPIVWTLVLGLEETASTYFFLKTGADTGDILHQVRVPVLLEDDARSLYDRLMDTALSQLEQWVPELVAGTYHRTAQNHAEANTWRKRGRSDGQIDFRMSSRSIYNLVRGLTRPYIGAHIVYNNQDIKVWKVREVKGTAPNLEPGKVLAITGRSVLIKCGDGAVELMDHELKSLPAEGDYL